MQIFLEPFFVLSQAMQCTCPAAADPKHHDLHLMYVAVYSLREGVGVGSLASFMYVLLPSNMHCTSELFRPAVTFNQDLFPGYSLLTW